MESFNKCIISRKLRFESSTLTDSLSTLTQQEVETAARYILNCERNTNATLKKLFTSIRGQSPSNVHIHEASSFQNKSYFHCGITLVHLQSSSLLLHMMNTISELDSMLHPKSTIFPVWMILKINHTICLI